MELKEAIEILKRVILVNNFESYSSEGIIIEAIETVLNHLTKQEKMIELMARFIDTELSSEHLSKVLKIDVKPLETYRENIKQYFEKKAEESEEMEEIEKLDCSICDTDYKEGLSEIIANLKTIDIDTRAMNNFTHCRYYGQKEMLEAIIEYLEKCL